MAAGKRRGGAGERVLESRHVIGLFLLMLLFSGVFFALGYVMGRNQLGGAVIAETNPHAAAESGVVVKPEPTPRRREKASPAETRPDANANDLNHHSDWDKTSEDHPQTVIGSPSVAPPAAPPAKTAVRPERSSAKQTPIAYSLQVAALKKQSDALDLAKRLQKKKFPAFVTTPKGDKYYRVQVGPYPDQKSADAARKGLENAGFKAIVKHG